MEIMTLKTAREVSNKKKMDQTVVGKITALSTKVQEVLCQLSVGNSMNAPGAFTAL